MPWWPYLVAQGFLGDPAPGGSPAVQWGKLVLDVQHLTRLLKDIVLGVAQVLQQHLPPVYGYQHLATVDCVLGTRVTCC